MTIFTNNRVNIVRSRINYGTVETLEVNGENIPLYVLSGTDYDMGFWYGKLIGKRLQECADISVNGAITVLKEIYGFSEDEEKNLLSEHNLTRLMTELSQHVPPYYNDFKTGIYDGCEEANCPILDPLFFERITALSEIAERECAMFAMHSPLTDGHTYQLRDLDYYPMLQLQRYLSVIIFLPRDEEGKPAHIPYVNFGYPNLLGVQTGINAHGVAISQIRGNFHEKSTLKGEPLSLIIKDILRESPDSETAIRLLKNKKRASNHFMIVGDPLRKSNSLNLLFSTGSDVKVYHPMDPIDNEMILHKDMSNYIPREGIVYWKQMLYDKRLNKPNEGPDILDGLIQEKSKPLGIESLTDIARSSATMFTIFSVVFDLTSCEAWFANRGATKISRTYFRLNLKEYFTYK